MKKVYLLALVLCCASSAFGQKFEYSVMQSTGLSRFAGESSTRNTPVVLQGPTSHTFTTYNPYGSRYNIAYGAAMQAQLVTGRGFLIGTQAGYEILRTRADINRADNPFDHHSSTSVPAEGKAVMVADYINLQPYLGWRLLNGTLDLDLTLGTDIAFNQELREKSEATPKDGTKMSQRQDRSQSVTDFRPRMGVTAYYGHLGVSVNYSHGLTNYFGNWDGGDPELYMRVLRLGLHFRL